MDKLLKSKRFYIEFFILFVLIFFALTYTVVNKNTIGEQIYMIKESGIFFAKTATYKVLDLDENHIGYDSSTYEIELLIFNEINAIRDQNDLEKLEWDPMLSKLARTHSFDMTQYKYLNHSNLLGEDPTKRAQNIGIKTKITIGNKIYTGIGENIGYMPKGVVENVGVIITTKDIASAMVYEWMLSSRHKDNILNDEYYFTGIGVSYDGNQGYIITQNFQ